MPGPTHVVLDANAIGVAATPLGALAHRLLVDAHEQGRIVLVVPRLTFVEAIHGWARKVQSARDQLRPHADRLRQLGRPVVLNVPDTPPAALRDEMAEQKTAWLETHGIALTPTPEVPHDALIDRAVTRRPPFDEQGGGYRDALLWELTRALADEGHDVVLVSNDKAFAEGRKQGARLAATLAGEVTGGGAVRLVPTVGEATALLDLTPPDDLETARRIVASFGPAFPETLRAGLAERLRTSLSPLRDTARSSLGLATEALGLEVDEARSHEGRIEAGALLTVRQKVLASMPYEALDDVLARHPGGWVTLDGHEAGVELEATVVHRCDLLLDPIEDELLAAEPVDVVEVTLGSSGA